MPPDLAYKCDREMYGKNYSLSALLTCRTAKLFCSRTEMFQKEWKLYSCSLENSPGAGFTKNLKLLLVTVLKLLLKSEKRLSIYSVSRNDLSFNSVE